MIGPLGVTTVPLPMFWSKDEGDQHRRSPRKEQPCLYPRCAANNMACSTPHKEPPTKRIKRPFKNTKPSNLAPVSSNGSQTGLESCEGIKAHGSYAANYSDWHFGRNVSPVYSRGTRSEWDSCGAIKSLGNNAPKHSDCRSPNNLSLISSKGTRTELETCRGIKASSDRGKYLDCYFALKNLSPISPQETRMELDTCGGIKAHGNHAGKFVDCKVGNIICAVSSKRTKTKVENRGAIKAHHGPAGKYADCIVANNLCPVSSKGTRTELENCRGIKAHTSNAGKHTENEVALSPTTMVKVRESFSVNPLKELRGNNSKESTTPISSSSHAPSIPTPIRRPSKPSKTGLAPLSVLERSSPTGSSSPGGYSEGTSQSLPTCRLLDSMDNPIDDQVTPSFLRGVRIAPPNSEIDEEEVQLIDELERHEPPLALPQYNKLPLGSSATSRCPTLLPTAEAIGRAVNLASNENFAPSNLPPPPLAGVPATIPPEATTKRIRAIQVHGSSSPAGPKPCEDHSSAGLHFGISEATAKDIRGTPIHCSSSPVASEVLEGHTRSWKPQETPKLKHFKSRRIPALTKSTESNRSITSSTLATMGSAAQMCILEQRLEDEDDRSNSSLTTLDSDSPKESCCMDLNSTLCGSKPISAFYNALYAPDCTLSGTRSEEQVQPHGRGMDAKLRVAFEIAMLSVMVTILVVVFYPAITIGLRSQFYDCCSCAAPSATAVSQNPSRQYSQASSNDGSCVYQREVNFRNCPSAQRTMGSTVVK